MTQAGFQSVQGVEEQGRASKVLRRVSTSFWRWARVASASCHLSCIARTCAITTSFCRSRRLQCPSSRWLCCCMAPTCSASAILLLNMT